MTAGRSLASGIRHHGSRGKGRALMGIPTLVRIADALKIDPGALLDGVTAEMFPATASDGRRSA